MKPLDLEFRSQNMYSKYLKKKSTEINSNSKLYDINRNGEWRHSNNHCDGITFQFSIKQPKIQSFRELAINGFGRLVLNFIRVGIERQQ